MKWDKSDWNLPQDMLLLVGLFFILPASAILLACFLPILTGARRGDPRLFWIASSLAIIGVFLLFIAKLPLYRQGKFFTLGSKALSDKHKILYRLAYKFIGISVVLMLLMLAMFCEMSK